MVSERWLPALSESSVDQARAVSLRVTGTSAEPSEAQRWDSTWSISSATARQLVGLRS